VQLVPQPIGIGANPALDVAIGNSMQGLEKAISRETGPFILLDRAPVIAIAIRQEDHHIDASQDELIADLSVFAPERLVGAASKRALH
jgi:hypothetical protein